MDIILGILLACLAYIITVALTASSQAALIVFILVIISVFFGGLNLGSLARRR